MILRPMLTRLLAVSIALAPLSAAAQGLVLPGTPPPDPNAPPPGDCASVTVGQTVSYDCLNSQQKALVAQQKAGLARAGLNQNSAPPQLGVYNQAATREHLGSSFGHSTVPQAVPPPVYSSPLIPPPH